MAISQVKKRDTMLAANSAGDTTTSGVLVTGDEVVMNMWAPATRSYDEVENSPADRNSTKVYFVGVKESLYMYANTPFIWRRVVFWSYNRYLFAESVENSEGTRYRRSEQFGPTTHPELVEEIFEGTLNTDYQNRTLFDAKVDRSKIRVISDRRRIINPGMERGALRDMKLWTNVRRRIIYDDDEFGRNVASSVWSAQTPGSMGNLYILDLFSVGINSVAGSEAGSVRYNSTTVYWRENS
ncbi:Cap protein [finch CRESS-DNA virus]|nr:Cap protein [finch CRESS-DNA virus]